MIHHLKIDHVWAERRRDNLKTSEVRKHDRDYQTGDTIRFECTLYTAGALCPCMAEHAYLISHVLTGVSGLASDYCVLSLHPKDGYGAWP